MDNKFGVTLKSTGAGKPTDRNFKPVSSQGSTTKKSSVSGPPKKFTDLKAQFDEDKKDQGSNKTARSPGTKRKEFGTDYSKKSVSSSVDKGKLTQPTKLEKQGESGFQRNITSRGSFERKTKIEEKSRQDSKDDNDGAQIAVGKVFTQKDSKTYTATVENRLQRQGSSDDPVDKVRASNLLTGQLAMLRIRPGSGGKKDERTTFTSRTVEKSNNGFSKVESTTTISSSNFNAKNKPFSTNSGSSGSPKFGKKFTSSSSTPIEFGLSYSPKKCDENKSRDLLSKTVSSHSRQSSSDSIGSSTSSPRSNKSTDVVLDTSSVKKLDALIGTGKVEHRGNRVETKTVTKTVETGTKRPGSPRTIVTETKIVTTSVSNKPGVNKTVRSREEVTTFSTSQSESHSWAGKKMDVIKTSSSDGKPEWLDKSQQLVSKFQTKMKPTTTDVLVTDKSNMINSRTPLIKPGDRTVNKPTVSKTTGVNKLGKTDINSNKMAPAWETRVTASSLQRRSSDLSDTGSDISSRSTSSLPSSSDLLKKKPYTIRKMEPGNFKKIMGNFEEISKSGSTTPERKISDPKIEFKKPQSRAKNIVLERKNSFECPPSPPISPRDATQLVLKETGPIPNVRKFAKEINSGRARAFSTGSIRDSGSDLEYNDALSRRHEDWPSSDISSEDEALYEFIGDPGEEDGDGKSRNSRNINRRHGQKSPDLDSGKGVHRPSFEEQSSSDMTTEGSSKDGTLESTDDRAVEGDAENDSDSSNSGIYEPINQDWVNKLKIEQSDQPPELPADRKKKKKKKDGNKSGAAAIGNKLKKLYNKPKKSGGEPGLSKVSSAPQLSLSEQSSSSGVLNKLGDKLKLITRAKSSDPKLLAEPEIVISSSEYDAEGYTEEDGEVTTMNIPLEDIVYIDSSSSIDQAESPEPDKRNDYEDTAPPLPPRGVSDEEDSAPKPPPKTRSSMINTIDANLGLVPMRPPKRNSSRPQSEDEAATPALPPRNRVSNNVNLDTVVPVTPGLVTSAHSTGDLRNSKGQWHASKDSYLHGHMMQSSKGTDQSDGPPPPPPQRSNSGEENIYIECDRPGVPERDGNKRPLEKKLSSLYMKSAEVASTPDKSPTNQNMPFQDIMKFQSQYQNTADDNMYLDLKRINYIPPVIQRYATIGPEDEDQLYGTLGERYTPKINASEPLYQYYHKDMASRASKKCTVMHAQSDDEEDDERIYEALDDVIESPAETKADRVKTSTLEMFTKKTGTAMRALWCEMPEVKESGLLEKLSSQERKIQEATFEIITSEATYLRSLNVLINTFLLSQEFSAEHSDRCVLTRQERHVIFSNIGSIRDASERFLSALEAKWQESVLMEDISSVIESHANSKFECYVRYCSNQTFQERQVQELMKKQEFSDAIRRMEISPECQGLPMMSFLLLPMQRITRLPLLVDAICHRMEPATKQHKGATLALEALNRVVRKCNDGARKMQQTEQMCRLVQNLEFKVKEIPLVSASRHLLKQGELTRVFTDTTTSRLLRKGKTKQVINIFLFNDLILISKKKRNRFSYSFTPQNINELLNTQYVVNDYAPRNALHVETLDNTDKSRYLPQGAPSGCKNLFVVVLLENHEQKHTELILSCKSPSDRTRWIDSLSPSAKENDSEKIYEEWDCPQVQCTKKYSATEPDELTLEESDVINVFKKMGDGWYEGERIRDGERGWFPSAYTVEIVNSHVRARNLRLRYRLLLASQDYGDVYS